MMKPILVIGGGISGVTAAVELAEAGKEVVLLEKDAHLGGKVVKLHNYFPKLCPPACGMEINYRRVRSNSRITVMTHSEVKEISGGKGDFKVKVLTSPQFINDYCTACGECVDVCPVERPDAFHNNFGLTKAVYLPSTLAFPQKYTIDANYCSGASCAKCVKACAYDAIDLAAKDEVKVLNIHSVIVASGWEGYDASNITELNYNNAADIVTNLEFESLISLTGPGKGKLLRPSNGEVPKKVAFVQCAGSRDRNHLPYCSAVCCSASLKHALNITEISPETEVSVFYIDLRVIGRNEDFLKRVEAKDTITLRKGKVASVEIADDGSMIVEAENIAAGKKGKEAFDLVVLATGMQASIGLPGLQLNEDGFVTPDQIVGVYAAASVKKPMDVSASVKDATSAAIKAMKPLS